MTDSIIRQASRNDAEDCYRLIQSDGDSYWVLDDLERSTEDLATIFLVAEEKHTVIGYIQGFILPTKRSEALIHETRVRREDRGKGIGSELVHSFCREAFARGSNLVLAEIEPDLLEFYRDSCGFSERGNWIEVGRRKEEARY